MKYEETFIGKRFEFQWKTQGVWFGCHSEEAEMEGEEGLDWVGLGWCLARKGVGLNLKAAFACL